MAAFDPIFEALVGYRLSAALRAAVELDVFTAIAKGKRTAAAIGRDVGASERGIRILLDALTAARLVLSKKENTYELTSMARRFLVRDSKEYIGGFGVTSFRVGQAHWWQCSDCGKIFGEATQ